VYLHKATRGAEKIFGDLMRGLANLVAEGRIDDTGLSASHPLVKYLREQSLANYAALDDSVIWGSLAMLSGSRDRALAESADRLRYRRLFKSTDVMLRLGDGKLNAGDAIEQRVLKFRRLLKAKVQADQSLIHRILIDEFKRDPYKKRGYETPKGIERIHILEDGRPVDLSSVSHVVAALRPFYVYRLYVAPEDEQAKTIIHDLIEEARK
jgi:hypothetical protein